jgi:hypothetical protein
MWFWRIGVSERNEGKTLETEKVNYSKILMVIMFVQDVEGLDSLKKKRTLLKIEFVTTSASMDEEE